MAEQRGFRVFRGVSGLSELERDWKKAASDIHGRRFFHLYEWHRSYAEALESDDRSLLYFVAYRNGFEIEAIFPLKRTRKRRFGIATTILESPNHPHLSLRDIVIVGNADHSGLLTDFVRFLAEDSEYKCDIVRVENALEDSAILALMTDQPHRLNVWEETGYCHYLPASPDQHGEGLSKGFRTQLRKSRSKAAKFGGTKYLSAREPDELPRFFQHFLEVEGSGWKKSQGTAIILHPDLRAFYESLMRQHSAGGTCEIDLLAVGNAIIAAQFSLIVDKTLYILKIGYDEQRAELSPGGLLLQDVHERFKNSQELEQINLITDAAWHGRWRPERYRVYCCRRFNPTLPGLLAFVAFHLKRMLRTLRNGGRRGAAAESVGDLPAADL